MRGAPTTRSSTLRAVRQPDVPLRGLGGTLFRIGIGAVPFLLPLMFQLGFGLTPFQSGMMTFVSAFGAIVMKFVARDDAQARRLPPVLIWRLAGRRVLRSASTACSRPRRRTALIMAVLLGRRLPALAVLHLRPTRWCSADIDGQGRQPGDARSRRCRSRSAWRSASRWPA